MEYLSTLGIGSVTKEGLFDSERFLLVAGMRRCLRFERGRFRWRVAGGGRMRSGV